MHPLYQRLKELDGGKFEELCFHLLKERYPGSAIRRVDGKGGDEGVDHFEGDLDGGSTVWQCKTFPNGIRGPQKEQIKKSLARVIGTVSPRKWILCTNVDFDVR